MSTTETSQRSGFGGILSNANRWLSLPRHLKPTSGSLGSECLHCTFQSLRSLSIPLKGLQRPPLSDSVQIALHTHSSIELLQPRLIRRTCVTWEMDSEAGGPGRSGGEGGTGSNESRHSWCVGRTRVKGCDVLWLRLAHPVLLLDSQGKPSASLGLNSPASAATVSDSAPNSRWVFLTRDWLFFSRAPFKGQLFEARVPVTALQVICTSLSSITQGRGLVVAAAEEWWARAAPPPSSNDGSYAGAAATAAMARDASVALRTFRSSGLRSTKPALVSGCGVPAAAVIGCERREQRRCDRRRTHRTEQSRAYLIGCRSVEERNWLLYCLQAAASSPPPLGFLRTLSALAEAELLLQQIALFVSQPH